ncbi:uncharacterized protein N0V89_003004 [Didymosphaeria variabile]|uniref:Uncharacterized protein n=1 Tax=Didymosphaeria variabile TaxID=1932322 RepID=A0A9W8XTK2_9PLEO|nr:uncharacterized protein N0V89_003004 [Didymosphaeria variabile]KAJ4358421.1 hypothetical protein N0V89_003004 [Didymosphaeria variabile]
MGKKRTNDGKEKRAASKAAAHITPPNDTPPGAQAPHSSSTPSVKKANADQTPNTKKQKIEKLEGIPANPKQPHQTPSRKQNRKKLPKLPPNAAIAKRPLHHPAIPAPFASLEHPKILYISHSTPFIPTVKRIRRLLLEISKRQVQSQASQISRQRRQGRNRKPLAPNGRLAPEDVEREIAEEGKDERGDVGGEKVYVKATGRAIERALRFGVHFQGESDCTVRVETGSVMAVDDIEIRNVEERNASGGGIEANEQLNDDDVPEMRVRMVSSVTVVIGSR